MTTEEKTISHDSVLVDSEPKQRSASDSKATPRANCVYCSDPKIHNGKYWYYYRDSSKPMDDISGTCGNDYMRLDYDNSDKLTPLIPTHCPNGRDRFKISW